MNSLWALLDSIPEDSIAITVYLAGSLIILASWYSIAKRLPNPLGGISWIVVFAVLLTPTVSEGSNASIAPAIFGLLFGLLTKDQPLVWTNLSLILFVIGIGFVIGFFWTKFNANKAHAALNKKSSPL
ncbi:hypothetical protein [Acinetobacter sp.]|jgi:hypothetical protein|uniref:hypothetical protein n=1 Tax=Acinetobacter sp. TaxID=472 RepID=UPI0035B3B5BB